MDAHTHTHTHTHVQYRFSLSFFNVNRTVCPILFENKSVEDVDPNPPPLFYIDVFTSSMEPWNYSVVVEPVDNFTL